MKVGPEGRVLPRHVQACRHSPEQRERWFIWTWKREAPATQSRVPYSCNSWRCPVCARHEAAVTFARIREASEPLDPSGWVFFVLTLDRAGYYSGEPWADVNVAFRSLGSMCERFLKRLRRMFEGEPGSNWVAVVESHRSGWPHINLMIHSPTLAKRLAAEKASRARSGATPRESMLIGGDLLEHAMACGWGAESTAEAARDKDAVASYIVKLAGNHDAALGELAKITQAPVTAPARFRRLRSGKGFLPPRRKNEDVTGCMVRRRRRGEDWEIVAVNEPKDPRAQEPTNQAIAAELAVLHEERELHRWRRLLPRAPRVRVAVAGELQTPELAWAESVKALETA